MAAQVVTLTERTTQSCRSIMWAWRSSSGVVVSETTNYYDGKIIGMGTVPGSTAAPTDDYDITITDSDGIDVLLGAGADRDTANTEYVNGTVLGGADGTKLELNIANAGDAKDGVVKLWVR